MNNRNINHRNDYDAKLNKYIKKARSDLRDNNHVFGEQYSTAEVTERYLQIKRLVKRSSASKTRFKSEIESLTHELDKILTPIPHELVLRANNNNADDCLIDYRNVLTKLSESSDTSVVDEPAECHTSVRLVAKTIDVSDTHLINSRSYIKNHQKADQANVLDDKKLGEILLDGMLRF